MDGTDIYLQGDTSGLDRLKDALSPAGRARIIPVATRRVFKLIQGHFRRYALTHHDSADRLGAKHTKHMERAARDMTSTVMGGYGLVTISMAGIGRARHDVQIDMKDKRLTIPIAKESYGRSAIEMEKQYGRLFVFRSRKGNRILAATVEKGRGRRRVRTLLPLYVLKESVFQLQDPDMLPTEREIARAGRDALVSAMSAYVRKGS